MLNKCHYVSLEIAKKFMAAGIEFGESEKVWFVFKNKGALIAREKADCLVISAPSLSEILDRLPEGTVIDKSVEGYWCYIKFMSTDIENGECSTTASDAAALMLLKLEEGE